MPMGIGLGIGVTHFEGVGADPAAAALFARFTPPPSDAVKQAYIDYLITPLRSGGFFSKLDFLRVWDTLDAQWARQNVIQDAHNASLVGGPTHTPKQGIAGNGSSSYVNENYNPGDGGAHLYAQDSAHLGFWSRTENSGTVLDMGCRVGTNVQNSTIAARLSTNQAGFRINGNTGTNVANATSVGHFVAQRTGSAAENLTIDGALIGTSTLASVSPGSLSVFLCGINNNGVAALLTSRQYSASHGGADLSPTDLAALRTILDNWHTAVGAL
jgi:hypothetical protein